jgi:hypothetical protein
LAMEYKSGALCANPMSQNRDMGHPDSPRLQNKPLVAMRAVVFVSVGDFGQGG